VAYNRETTLIARFVFRRKASFSKRGLGRTG
jgi:hypothetical protein